MLYLTQQTKLLEDLTVNNIWNITFPNVLLFSSIHVGITASNHLNSNSFCWCWECLLLSKPVLLDIFVGLTVNTAQ